MNLFWEHKQYLILLVIGICILSFIFIISFSLLRAPTPTDDETIVPNPTESTSSVLPKDPEDPYSDAYKESVKKINEQEKSLLDQDKKVSAFISTLPVQGIDFTASYDIGTNSVTVTIPSARRAEGEKEFDAYLLANGIKQRSWIQNLTIRYRDIDPDAH